MRIHCTDDEQADIMDLSEALDLSAQHPDDEPNLNLENHMATKKSAPAAAPAPAAAAPAAETAAATGGPRAIPEGHTGLNTLAEKFGTTPAAMRRKLRGMEGFSKPEGQHGWYWKDGSPELAAVTKAFTEPAPAPAAAAPAPAAAAPAPAAPAKRTKK